MGGDKVRVSTHLLFKIFGIASHCFQKGLGDLQMEEFLFDFWIQQNFVWNICFQNSFVDVSDEPILAEKVVD